MLRAASGYLRPEGSVCISNKCYRPTKLCDLEFARVLKDKRFETLVETLKVKLEAGMYFSILHDVINRLFS